MVEEFSNRENALMGFDYRLLIDLFKTTNRITTQFVISIQNARTVKWIAQYISVERPKHFHSIHMR